MRLTRVHASRPLASGDTVKLDDAAGDHVVRVLRLRAGASLVLFDGSGSEFAGEIVSIGRGGVVARVGERRAISRESPLRITLLQALARAERMDFVVQKATELGVTRIVPVGAERSVVQIDARGAERKVAHWRAVAIAACEQSGRNVPPVIDAPLTLDAACGSVAGDALRIAFDPDATSSLRDVLGGNVGNPPIAILIGPEGGLTAAELALASARGFASCRFGPRILRTETAAVAALAAVQALRGDLG